jgi:hypothetical protein
VCAYIVDEVGCVKIATRRRADPSQSHVMLNMNRSQLVEVVLMRTLRWGLCSHEACSDLNVGRGFASVLMRPGFMDARDLLDRYSERRIVAAIAWHISSIKGQLPWSLHARSRNERFGEVKFVPVPLVLCC